MEYKTFEELKDEVFADLNLEGNLFISETEFYRIANRAIDYCEARIHKYRCEDTYFEACGPIALVSGVQDYGLPSDIYANKIKKIVCQKSDWIYEVTRLKGLARYLKAAYTDQNLSSTQAYQYMVINNAPTLGPRMRFFPRPQETTTIVSTTATWATGGTTMVVASATGISAGQFLTGTGIPKNCRVVNIVGTTVTFDSAATAAGSDAAVSFTEDDYLIYYIRNANKVSASTDLIDIPEFYQTIVQFCKVECLKKELGNPRLAEEDKLLSDMKIQMDETLAEMTPDEDNKVEVDNSYEEEIV